MAGSAIGGTLTVLAAGAGTGLVAGAVSCAPVQFGLLTGAVRGSGRTVAPVTAFLAARLAAHTALGALLGGLGAMVAPGPQVRAMLLVAAGALLTIFALDLLGVPVPGALRRNDRERCPTGPPGCSPSPGLPDQDGQGAIPRRRPADDRAEGATAVDRGKPSRPWHPAVWGASTVMVPCGVTLSAELMAAGTRSPVGGAAVMAGFVLGTAPMFALLGMALGRGLRVARGRLGALAGVALLAVAGWTLVSGLRLGGWLPSPGPGHAAAEGFVRMDASGVQTITVWALDRGYRPATFAARAGQPTVLVVRTRGAQGCTRAFTMPGRGLERVLPVTGEVRIPLGSPGTGRLRFTCATGHYPGSITFR